MNKTRMGKRAASLLLSLVMMLSLLPTAAYATMADGAETQDAIVSGNGTGVSDDSNSSGNTDDLQVGDSKDSDGTGDQQVEGSNGSGTADDTTGTEGGADPTDSVNGNDSADPQDDGDAVLPAAANVAKVGDTEYATLEAAIAALGSSSYTLELLDESVWEAATPVYWAAGSESGYAATLAEALTAAYKANAGAITIVCRPGADVGELTHGHVADDITIYGNNAYISGGECDLEVDTYTFSRDTGKQVEAGGAYLEKDITVTAYELDNLGVWGQRHTDHKVTVNLTDCDSTDGITVQRVYISGTTGVNDITLTGCDFGTKATSVYSNADGAVVIDNCSFTGAQVPVNFNHKANGTQTVAVQNSTFTNCGDNGDWKQFAAPVRFVNSGSGTMDTTVNTCTFTDTVGSNGDILLGDGRVDQNSNDVALTVESTKATVQAQQPGYYGKDGTTDESKQGTKNVAAGDKLTTSVTQLMPSETPTYVAEVNGIQYETLQAAIDAAAKNATVTLLADTRENVTISTYGLTLDLNGHTLNGGTVAGKPALTVDNKKVTLKDSSEAQTGTIKREDTADTKTSHYVIDIQGKNGFMIVESGKVENNSGIPGVKGSSLIRLGNDSVSGWPTLTIKGGTFTQDNFIAIKVDRGTLHLLGGTVNSANSFAIENWNNAYIKGGTVNGTVSTWVYSTGAAFSKLEISGGTVNGNVASVNYDNAADKQARVYVTGGTVTGTLGTYTYNNGLVAMDETAKATIEVTGGTFSKDPTQYVVEDSAISKNDDGTYGVAKTYLAKIGDTEYYTMDEAFHAVKAGETIVMLRDYTTNKVQNSGDESFTIDLGGHTWTANIVDTASAAFEINYSDVTLTVKNGKVVSSQLAGLIPSAMSGTITYNNSKLVFDGVEMTANGHSGIETNGSNTNDTVTLKNSTLNVPNGYGIYFPSSGTLTIDNSVINAKTMGVQVCSGSLNISGAGTAITVTGDGIAKTENDGAIEDGAAISIVNRTGYKGLSNIEVKDGKFKANGTNAAVKAYKWEDQTASAFDNSKNVVAISGGTFSSEVDKSLCADGFIPTKNEDGTYGVKEGQYVAEVGSTKYATLQAAIDKAGRNATVRLLADTRENVTIAEMMTLDLNGHTLNGGTEKGKPALTVTARVTVKDSSEAKTGTIKREDTAENSGVSSHYVIDVQGAGWLTFESGKVTNDSGNDSGKGASLVRVGDDSIAKYPGLNIKGGTFTQDNFIVIKVDRGDLFLNGGTLNSANSYAIEDWHRATIKGGTVNGTVAAWTYSGGHNSDLTISGGTVNGNVASVSYDKAEGKAAKVSISGGTVNGTLGTYTYGNGLIPIEDPAKATIAVTGGTFSKDPSKYVVEDSGVTPNGDGTFGVAKAYLAKVGDTSYYTMDEAFKAQTTSDKAIVLLRDYTTGSTFNSGSIARTVDLNGHTWTCTGTDANSAAFEINYPDATLTVKNGKVVSSQLVGLIPSAMGGTIKYDNSSLVFDGVEMTTTARSGIETNGNNTNDTVKLVNSTLNVPNGFGIYFPSSGTLTIDNSVINAKTMGVQVCSGSLNVSGAGTAITVSGDGIPKTINDGAIEDGAAISIVNRAGYKDLAEIKVEGGKFTAKGDNAAVKAYDWANQTENAFTQSDKVSISGGTFSSVVDKSLCADGFIPTQNADGTYSVKEGKYVAEIGSQGYESLTEAIGAAQDGQTVTLLADAAEDVVISKSITLDLGGKTLTNTNVGKATISVTGGTVTVKNGNVVGGTSYYNIEAKKDANLTLTDVTATAGNNGSSMIDNWGTLTITSGTYTGGLNVVKSEEDSKLTITGGTFELSYATNGYTGVIFAYGDTTISGGEFIQSLTTTGRWNHPTVVLTGVVEGHTAITRVTGGHFVNKMSGESIFRGVGKATSDNFKVSGGTFNKSIPDAYCADGFIPTKNADGTYGVKEGQYVAQIGSKKYETLADAIRLATKGQTITLLADVADCGSLTISKNITLDGDGHTISGNSSISVNMPGKAAADVTIKNVTFKDIANGNKLSAFYFSQVKGKLTITGCTFDSIEYEAIQVTPMEGAEINISNNVFKAKADGTQVRHIHIEMAYGSGFDCEGQNIKLTVTDNQLHGTVSGDASMGIWWVGTDSTLKVDGNYMEHPETVCITLSNSGVRYNRGDLIYTARSQADADVDDLMPAVIVAEKASGESKIKAYSTLAEAINAAQAGQTVRLLADVEQNTQLTINKSITLDLNGKTIRNTADIWGDKANAILSITNGAKVTITGNGTIDAKENDCYTINVVKGDLTIENGTFYGNVSVVQVQEGTLSVKGGTFDLHQKWEGSSKYLINCIDDAYVGGSANVAISGGTFVGFDPNVSPEQKVDGKTSSFAAPGVGITKNENGSFTAVDGMTAQILDKDGNSVKAYSTLAEAVAAAQDGQTVRLLADVAESSIKVNANITIDLNKMTVTGSFVTYGEVTIQNGTIDVPDGKTNYAYGKLTLADVDITGKAASSSLLSVNYNGSVTIDKDSTIVADSAKGDYPAVFIKGQDDSGKTYAPELNIYGTVQSAKTPAIQGNGTDRGVSHVNVFEGAVVKSEKLAIYLPQPCEVNITGGLVEGYCGIGIKSGTLNISGGTVRGVANDNVIGDEYSQTNGISYDGSAIMIDSYIGYAGQVQINISGNAVVESKYSTAIREIGNDKSQTNLVGLDITGGTVLGAKDTDAVLVRDVTAKDVNISGGEFSSIVKKEYCAPGFTPVTTANSEGRYGVKVGMFTVMVTSRTTGSNSPVANVTGGGSNITYAQGTKVTASAISGYKFVGWFVNEYTGTPYSTDLACEVKPTDDCTMIAVYEPISGGVFALEVSASKFTVNGGATQRSYLLEKMPVGTQVTVVFKGSENFLYWVNESGKVVSTSKTYTFSMGSATTLKAVYAEKEEHQAMVVFISHTQQVISSKGYTDTQEIQFPEPPIKMGATFVRWSMTEAEIRAAMATTTTGIIVVEPVYEFNAGSYTVTVNYPNDETATYTATVGKITTVTAKSIDGKVFKCWKNGDTVLGYTETLRIAPRGDLTLTAEYVDAGTTVDRLPVIALTEISASQQGAKYAVSFTATRSVPDGYTVTEQGVLVSTDSRYGEEGALDAMKLDADGDEPDNTQVLKATNTDATGVTVLNGIVSAADRTVYGRAYMILRDSSGTMVYVYSDTILSGSYNSLTTNGGN